MELKKQTSFLAKLLRDKALGSPKEASKYAIHHYESINGEISKQDLINNYEKYLTYYTIIKHSKFVFAE